MRAFVSWWLLVGWVTVATAQPARLRVGIPEGLPGYTLSAHGRMHVEAPDKRRFTQCVEAGLQVQFVWEAYPTRRVLQMLADAQLDLAFPMGFNEERAARLLQSEPTWENPDVWLSLKPVDPHDKRLRLAARLGSPQHDDVSGVGFSRVIGSITYDELPRLLSSDMADAVIVPQSVSVEMKSLWPAGTRVTPGRARSVGFYLPKADVKGLAGRLNQAILRCRGAMR